MALAVGLPPYTVGFIVGLVWRFCVWNWAAFVAGFKAAAGKVNNGNS